MRFAAIFDVDGVLVDSYAAHYESWRLLGDQTGVKITERDFSSTFGQTSRDIISRFWPFNPDDHTAVESLDCRKELIYRELVSADFPVMDGAIELFESLHDSGFAMAVGSSGPPENVDLAIDRLGVGHLLSAVVTGKDVCRGKPDPEVFLIASMRLGVRPAQCAVIEDAPAGIVAAHKAGMATVALLSRGHASGDFGNQRPDLFVNSLRELTPSTLINVIQNHL